MISFEIGPNDEGQRLDRFLRKLMPRAPLSLIYKLIRKDIKVDRKRVDKSFRLTAGGEIALYLPEERLNEMLDHRWQIFEGHLTYVGGYHADIGNQTKLIKPCNTSSKQQISGGLNGEKALILQGRSVLSQHDIFIIYEDENIAVVHKPVGMLTHGDGREKKVHLANYILDYFIYTGAFIPRSSPTFRPASTNRLDRNTEGLVIFGKNSQSLRELNKLFSIKVNENARFDEKIMYENVMARNLKETECKSDSSDTKVQPDMQRRFAVEKTYLALVEGCVDKSMQLRGFLIKDEKKNRSYLSDVRKGDSKYIATDIEPVKDVGHGKYTLIKIRLLTGRSHQIRLHLSSIGHPLAGDIKYGGHEFKGKDGIYEHQMLLSQGLKLHIQSESPLYYLNDRDFSITDSKFQRALGLEGSNS